MKSAPTAAPTAPVAAPAPVAAQQPEVNRDLIVPKPTPELNPRNALMKEIAARSNAQADVDASESVPVTDDEGNVATPAAPAEAAPEPVAAPEPEAAAEGAEPAVEAAPEAPAQPAAPAIPGIDPNGEYEFVVDGRPVKVKGAQVISRVQKGEVADYRLQIATELLENAKKQVLQHGAAAQPPAPGAAQVPVEAPTLTHEQLAEMVQFGTKEQAAQAIAEIERRQKPAVTPEQLSKMVDHQLTFREATRFAQSEYGDLLADPYLRQMFFWKEDQLRQAGDTRGYTDLYKAIGDELRTHFNKPKPLGAASTSAPVAPTKPATPAPTLAQRQAAKAAAPAAPKLASVRLEGGADQQKPKSREEIIEQMRTRRGQTSLTHR